MSILFENNKKILLNEKSLACEPAYDNTRVMCLASFFT